MKYSLNIEVVGHGPGHVVNSPEATVPLLENQRTVCRVL